MSTVTRNVELPPQVVLTTTVICNGCSKERPETLAGRAGWLQQFGFGEKDGKPGDTIDYCTDCRPKIERAQKQETDAIRAETIAAVADVRGVV